MLHTKKSFGNHAQSIDSSLLAHDRSAENSYPPADEGASAICVSIVAQGHSQLSMSPQQELEQTSNSKQEHCLTSSVIPGSDGIDSPICDGGIASTAAAGHHHHSLSSTPPTLGTPHVTTLSGQVSSLRATLDLEMGSPIASPRVPGPNSDHPKRQNTTPQALNVLEEPTITLPPPEILNSRSNPAALTPEEIQAFVRKAIDGEPWRDYEINQPPVGRPIRIFADGVYDLFHFGHASQLRQAKMSFPSVYLLVGVVSDELVTANKAQGIMSHAERCEAVRYCGWVDEVVPDAPWILTEAFINKHQIDYVAHDEDPYPAAGGGDVYEYVKSQGKFLPTRRTPGISTSELLERIVIGYRRCDFDKKLIKMGRAELRAEGSDFVQKVPVKLKVDDHLISARSIINWLLAQIAKLKW